MELHATDTQAFFKPSEAHLPRYAGGTGYDRQEHQNFSLRSGVVCESMCACIG
ncbi:MAG: hypothetical protein ACQEVA_14755 [Myxococcota bacterium]